MKRVIALCATAGLMCGLGADSARADYPFMNADGVYTLVNLRPDGREISSVNYQRHNMLPLCTKVRFIEEGSDWVRFVDEATGDVYTYVRYGKLRMPWYEHLDCVFGTRCNRDDAATLSRIDRKGIAEAKVYKGMSKQGVIYAIGYPPDHATRSLGSDRWMYWGSRWNRFQVQFDGNGRVTRVRD